MFNNTDLTIDSLKEYSTILDSSNYKSMLLVYDPTHPDYFTRVANIINKDQKIKYMFAIRTYAVSPEFLSMICESFNEIDQDRIVLNVCAGDKAQMQNENNIDGVIDFDILRNDVYGRILYTRKWIEKFINLKVMSKVPYLIFSGTSDYTLETTKLYGNSTLCMYNSFVENPEKFKIVERRMVALAIIISDSKESALNILKSYNNSSAEAWTLYGTEEDIKKEFIRLENLGATDILISNPFYSEDSNKIHNLIRSI
jgi:hypothetical protein